MNKITSILGVLLACSLPLFGAAANIVISGTVPDKVSVTPSANTVNVGTDPALGWTDVTLATLNEKSNKKNGYSITITTLNAADGANYFLLGTTTSESITYTLKHGSDSFVKDGDSKNYAKTTGGGNDVVLSISCAVGDYSSDSYGDTITVTIAGRN